jgi:hypothetical protein
VSTLRTYLLCGCPSNDNDEHRPGCWLAAAETVALQAHAAHGSIEGLTLALTEAGYLRAPAGDKEVVWLLDALVEIGLLDEPDALPADGAA